MMWILAALLGGAPAWGQAPPEPTIEELLNATDDASRGESSIAVIRMEIKTSRYERSMKMKAWSKGTERSLIKILEPAKDAGLTTLRVGDNLWNYLPKVDRTMKIPSGLMGGSWMGSHFTNDDLVRDSRLSEDFTYELTQRPGEGGDNYIVSCVPKPDAPVVWGKVVAEIRPDKVPVKVDYYDDDGTLVRTMSYDDVREVNGQLSPRIFQLTPHDKPGEYTRMTFEELQLGADIPDEMFNLQALKKQ
ncbi:MAG TPA: outer membrane lipoprotein-sorting protein [Deltaproteobacteria bacterium]|nr:outer membrane lipoprotein-sorting protein [Deltaproteobacteria bacterium]